MTYDDSNSRAQQARNEAEHSPAPAPASREASGTIPATQGVAKGGAPAGNRNNERHGVWSFLALGRLPKGASYIRRLIGELRRELERSATEAHGRVSLTHAALVTTVCRHEGRALLLSRYLALEGDCLKLLERMSMLEAIGRATDARDKAIRALGLDRTAETDWYGDYLAGRTTDASAGLLGDGGAIS